MQKEDHKILAVNPGSRYVGIAVFLGTELRDWAVKVIKNEKKIGDIISHYIHQYGITHCAVKRLHPSRTSKVLNQAVALLKNYVNTHIGCLYEYSIDDVKKNLVPNEKTNKKRLMDEIVVRYPFLQNDLNREGRNKNPYLIRMFEAVGIGACCLQEIDKAQSDAIKNKSQKS
ncbi:MAG: hypothetical protein AB1600_02535 [Bacteroidota bacterium]